MKKIFVIALLGVLMLPLCGAAKPETLNLKQKTMEIIPVTVAPVSLALAKKHLNVDADFTDDDEIIQMYIDGACDEAVSVMGRPLAENRVYPRTGFVLFDFTAYAKASVTSVKYAFINEDSEIEYATLPVEDYLVRPLNNYTAEISFKGTLPVLPSGVENPVIINVSTECPANVINGILLKVGKAYERREDTTYNVTDTAALNAWRAYRIF